MLINTINYNGKIYHLKLSIQDLIDITLLKNDEDMKKLIFILSIKDNVNLDEKNNFYNNLKDIDNVNITTLRFSNGSDNILFITTKEINFLYSLVVGEMGILPSEFYQMSLMEIFFAYKGHLKKIEAQAKLQQLVNTKTPIPVIDNCITNEEKNNLLKELGIGGNNE